MTVSHLNRVNGNPPSIRPLGNLDGEEPGIDYSNLRLQLKVQNGLVSLNNRT